MAPHLLARPAPVPRDGRCRVLRSLNGRVVTYGDLGVAAAAAERQRATASSAAQLDGLASSSLLPKGVAPGASGGHKGRPRPASARSRRPPATQTTPSARRGSVQVGDGGRPARSGSGDGGGATAKPARRQRPASARRARDAGPGPLDKTGASVGSGAGSGAEARQGPRPGQSMSEFIRSRQVAEAALRDAAETRHAAAARVRRFLVTGDLGDEPAEPEPFADPSLGTTGLASPTAAAAPLSTTARGGGVTRNGGGGGTRVSAWGAASPTKPRSGDGRSSGDRDRGAVRRVEPGCPPPSAPHIAASQQEFEVRRAASDPVWRVTLT